MMQQKQKTIGLVANTPFALLNFRKEFIATLLSHGYHIVAITPDDCLFLPGQDIKTQFENMGVQFIPCEFERIGTNPVTDLKSMKSLYTIFKNLNPDVIFNYTVKPTIYGTLAAWWAGVPVITSNITGIGSILTAKTGYKNKVLSKILFGLYRASLKRNKVVFFQNPDDLEMFKMHRLLGATPTKLLNGSGVDLDYFQRQTPLGDIPKFLFIGRLLTDKGIWEYIEAARLVKEKYPQIVCSVLGHLDDGKGGFNKGDLEAAIKSGAIKYYPPVTDIRPILEDHNVTVLPSYREGTPRAILESMAMSMPIITTDAPGCRETVENDQNGFLVPVQSVDELVEKMVQFIETPDLVARLSKGSRRIAEDKYNVHKVVSDIMAAVNLSPKS